MEKVFTEGSLQVNFLHLSICMLSKHCSLSCKFSCDLQMRVLNWDTMDLVFSLWQIVVQTQMGLSFS